MCEQDDDLGKTAGRAPIGSEELDFFSTLKEEDDAPAPEKRSGIAEPSQAAWAEVDVRGSDRSARSRRVWVMVIVLVSTLVVAACAWLLLAGGR